MAKSGLAKNEFLLQVQLSHEKTNAIKRAAAIKTATKLTQKECGNVALEFGGGQYDHAVAGAWFSA